MNRQAITQNLTAIWAELLVLAVNFRELLDRDATAAELLEAHEQVMAGCAKVQHHAFAVRDALPEAQRLEAAARSEESTAALFARTATRAVMHGRDATYLQSEADAAKVKAAALRAQSRQLGRRGGRVVRPAQDGLAAVIALPRRRRARGSQP